MKKIFNEFKEFVSKGSVLDMAVGIIVGGAFTAIVNSLVNSLLNPLLGSIFKKDFSELVANINGAEVRYGEFIMAIINFLLIAIVLFLLLKGINSLRNAGKKLGKNNSQEEEAAPAPTTKVCPYCRSEIAIEATRCPHCTSELSEE